MIGSDNNLATISTTLSRFPRKLSDRKGKALFVKCVLYYTYKAYSKYFSPYKILTNIPVSEECA